MTNEREYDRKYNREYERADEREDRLASDASRLAKSIPPGRDLWPGIEAAIAGPARPAGRPWLAQAAAVLLLIGASSLVTYTLTVDEAGVAPAANGANPGLAPASFGGEYQLGADYQLARVGLETRLDEVLERLSPVERAEVEENLDIIQRAIAEINAALERQPDNVLLQEMLLDTYREELTVMQNVGGLTQGVMLRNDI